MNHPFPTTANRRREHDGTTRDLEDLAALRQLRRIVAQALIEVAGVDDLQHPARRWSAADLVEVLEGQLLNIDGERERIMRGPVVIEDEA